MVCSPQLLLYLSCKGIRHVPFHGLVRGQQGPGRGGACEALSAPKEAWQSRMMTVNRGDTMRGENTHERPSSSFTPITAAMPTHKRRRDDDDSGVDDYGDCEMEDVDAAAPGMPARLPSRSDLAAAAGRPFAATAPHATAPSSSADIDLDSVGITPPTETALRLPS